LERIAERFTVFDSGRNSTISQRGKRKAGVKRESEERVGKESEGQTKRRKWEKKRGKTNQSKLEFHDILPTEEIRRRRKVDR
jgi:hypothetical protein